MKQQKPNSGALFKNDRKTTDAHPDLSGSINIDGRDYWLSGWTKRNDDNSFKLLSLSVKPKDQQAPQKAREEAFGRKPAHEDFTFTDDDLPF